MGTKLGNVGFFYVERFDAAKGVRKVERPYRAFVVHLRFYRYPPSCKIAFVDGSPVFAVGEVGFFHHFESGSGKGRERHFVPIRANDDARFPTSGGVEFGVVEFEKRHSGGEGKRSERERNDADARESRRAANAGDSFQFLRLGSERRGAFGDSCEKTLELVAAHRFVIDLHDVPIRIEEDESRRLADGVYEKVHAI